MCHPNLGKPIVKAGPLEGHRYLCKYELPVVTNKCFIVGFRCAFKFFILSKVRKTHHPAYKWLLKEYMKMKKPCHHTNSTYPTWTGYDIVTVRIRVNLVQANFPQEPFYFLLDLPLAIDTHYKDPGTKQYYRQYSCSYYAV